MRSKTFVLYLKVVVILAVFSFMLVALVTRLEMLPATSAPSYETNVERYWIEADTKEGFMEVKKILGDPRTTIHPELKIEGFLEFEMMGNSNDLEEENG